MEFISKISMKNLILAAIALIVLSGGLALGMVNYTTSNPSYCLSCHATQETPNMGQVSKVHPPYSVVGCTECHARPGQNIFIEGYQGGFSADENMVDPNCKRCHNQVASGAEITVKVNGSNVTSPANSLASGQKGAITFKHNEKNINIPHKLHVSDLGAPCTACHANIVHDASLEPTNRPPMETCYSCHDAVSTPCEKCHKS